MGTGPATGDGYGCTVVRVPALTAASTSACRLVAASAIREDISAEGDCHRDAGSLATAASTAAARFWVADSGAAISKSFACVSGVMRLAAPLACTASATAVDVASTVTASMPGADIASSTTWSPASASMLRSPRAAISIGALPSAPRSASCSGP